MALPVFDAVSECTPTTGVSSRTWSHTCGTLTNGCLVVGTGARVNTTPANLVVSSVTYNGVAMTKQREDASTVSLGTSLWTLINPPSGAHNVVVTWTGNIDNVVSAWAISYSNVNQATPVHATAGQNIDSGGSAITKDLTTTVPNCLVIDSMYQTDDLGQTVGAGQTARSNRIVTGVSTDGHAGSEEAKAEPGTVTMSWTANSYFDVAQSLIALLGTSTYPQLERGVRGLVRGLHSAGRL